MKNFLEWIKDNIKEDLEDLTGLYPPGYGGISNYPASYTGQSNPYLAWSRKDHTKKKKRKKKKKKS